MQIPSKQGRRFYMDDTSSQNNEKSQEMTPEKRKTGWGTGKKIGFLIIVLAIVIFVAAVLTVSVVVTNTSPGDALPFTTMYGTSFPEGQTIQIGNTQISAISYQNTVTTDVNGNSQQLEYGQIQNISEQHARITTLGGIPIMDTNFQIDLTYKGALDNRAYFDIAIHTGSQVPETLMRLLLPASIDARPI